MPFQWVVPWCLRSCVAAHVGAVADERFLCGPHAALRYDAHDSLRYDAHDSLRHRARYRPQ